MTGYLAITRITGDPEQLREFHDSTADEMTAVASEHNQLLHAAAFTDDGMVMVNVWPTQEDCEASAADPRRIAVLRSGGIRPEHVQNERYAVRLHTPAAL